MVNRAADVRRSVDLGSERVFSLLPPATAKNAVTTLEDQGFVHRHDTKWRIVDPLLGDWLRRRFR